MLHIKYTLLSIFLITFALVSPTQSQCPPIYQFAGGESDGYLGSSVALAGDVNNDGVEDFIVGAYGNLGSGNAKGKAYVFSGLTGDTLYIFDGEARFDAFGISVASAGDVNNDGYADLIIGAHLNDAAAEDAGKAYVFSGFTGDTLHVFTGAASGDALGFSVGTAGDIDSDGYDDVIVGAHFNDAAGLNAGRAYVFSGRTGDTLHIFDGEAIKDIFGVSVSSMEDIDGDGINELIIGAPSHESGVSTGRVYVFSGRTGDTLHVFTGESSGDLFGWSLASAGDVNNDGFDDIIVGALGNDAGGQSSGRAYVFSGLTGDNLHVFTGVVAGDEFGVSVAEAGDVNNDGFDDLIIGAYFHDASGLDAGRAYIHSGKTGELLQVFDGTLNGDGLGGAVSSAGDIDSDGFYEIMVGAIWNDDGAFRGGSAYVFTVKECLCADANFDLLVNVDDVDFLMNFYFFGGAAPFSYLSSDLNCDGSVNIADITYLAAYLNGTGAAPCCAE